MSRTPGTTTQPASEAELIPVIGEMLSRAAGKPVTVERMRRRHSPYRTSFWLEEIDVWTGDFTVELFFKDLSLRHLREDALAAKPMFLYDPRREIETYRQVLEPAGRGTPGLWGSVVDEGLDRYWLFLGHAPGVGIYQIGDLAAWEAAARWLARFHSRFSADDARALAKSVPLLRHDAAWYRQWLERALEIHGGHGECAALQRVYERAIEHAMALPRTVIHGEFFASNILAERVGGDWKVHPIDWELTAVGPGLFDLAALVAGAWTEEQRGTIAAAYWEIACSTGSADERAFRRALEWCRLHLAVQRMGWSANWTPPAEHVHDWRQEALDLALRLQG